MRERTVSTMDTDPLRVANALAGPNPDQRPHWYQKHMCHHMVPGVPLFWAETVVNVHLIRHPARVIASYLKKREDPTALDIGFIRQTEIFAALPGPVIDSFEIRRDPKAMLGRLCAEIGLPFDAKLESGGASLRRGLGRALVQCRECIDRLCGARRPPARA
jgi:hypothetical protein